MQLQHRSNLDVLASFCLRHPDGICAMLTHFIHMLIATRQNCNVSQPWVKNLNRQNLHILSSPSICFSTAMVIMHSSDPSCFANPAQCITQIIWTWNLFVEQVFPSRLTENLSGHQCVDNIMWVNVTMIIVEGSRLLTGKELQSTNHWHEMIDF